MLTDREVLPPSSEGSLVWLVTGASGQLGGDLTATLKRVRPFDVVLAPPRSDMDLVEVDSIRTGVRGWRPDIIVNCAAWTRVDDAETHREAATLVNAVAPAVMAEEMAALGEGLMLQVSTDYVFGDTSRIMRREGDVTSPAGVYAETKCISEESVRTLLPDRHAIVRTAWLYGVGHRNFVRSILERLRMDSPVEVVNDQFGNPTWSMDAAKRIVHLGIGLMEGGLEPGTYHAVNDGSATWWDFASDIAQLAGFDPTLVRPISTDHSFRLAKRPSYSVLGDEFAISQGLVPMRSWRRALEEALPLVQRALDA